MSARLAIRLLLLILAAQIALGVGWTAAVPLWQGHEIDFFHVTRYLLERGRLPTVGDYPPGTADTAQVTQPPLYFLVASPVLAALDSGAPLVSDVLPTPLCIAGETTAALIRGTLPAPEAAVFPPRGAAAAGYGLRLLNLAFGVAAVICTFAAGRALFPERPALALIGAALLAFEPSTLRMVTFISNDTLLLAIAAANLYCAARLVRGQPVQWGWAAAMLLLAALAVLTRLTGWAVLGLNALVLLAVAGRVVARAVPGRAGRRQARIALGLVAVLVIGVVALALFNLSTSGSVFGRYSFLDQRVGGALSQFDFSPLLLTTVLDRTRLAFLEPLGLLSPRHAVSVAYALAPLLALGGALAALGLNIAAAARRRPAPMLAGLLLLWAAFLTAAGLVYFRNVIDAAAYGGITEYNTAGVFTPIRYYAPGLPAFALLVSAGLLTLLDWIARLIGRFSPRAEGSIGRWSWLPGAALAAVWAGVMLLGILLVARPVDPVPAWSEAEARALPGIIWLDDAPADPGVPRILGYAAAPGDEAGMTDLTLYAALNEPGPNALGRIVVRADGALVSACEFVPGRGTLPLPVWQPGTVYALDIRLPYCGGVDSDTLDLAVEWQAADATGALIGDPSAARALGTIPTPGQPADNCPHPLGRIAGYTILKYTGPAALRADDLFQPSLNWIVEDLSRPAAGRVYTFTHDASGQTYTCAGTDGPLDQWTRATYRYFDRCVFTFPADAPRGAYTVRVALLDDAGAPLPARGPNGEPLADGQVTVGQLTLE